MAYPLFVNGVRLTVQIGGPYFHAAVFGLGRMISCTLKEPRSSAQGRDLAVTCRSLQDCKMAPSAKSEVLLTLYAECAEVCVISLLTLQSKSLSWTRSVVELTRRYILILSEDSSRTLFKCSIPDILTVARYTMSKDHPYTVRLQVG